MKTLDILNETMATARKIGSHFEDKFEERFKGFVKREHTKASVKLSSKDASLAKYMKASFKQDVDVDFLNGDIEIDYFKYDFRTVDENKLGPNNYLGDKKTIQYIETKSVNKLFFAKKQTIRFFEASSVSREADIINLLLSSNFIDQTEKDKIRKMSDKEKKAYIRRKYPRGKKAKTVEDKTIREKWNDNIEKAIVVVQKALDEKLKKEISKNDKMNNWWLAKGNTKFEKNLFRKLNLTEENSGINLKVTAGGWKGWKRLRINLVDEKPNLGESVLYEEAIPGDIESVSGVDVEVNITLEIPLGKTVEVKSSNSQQKSNIVQGSFKKPKKIEKDKEEELAASFDFSNFMDEILNG